MFHHAVCVDCPVTAFRELEFSRIQTPNASIRAARKHTAPFHGPWVDIDGVVDFPKQQRAELAIAATDLQYRAVVLQLLQRLEFEISPESLRGPLVDVQCGSHFVAHMKFTPVLRRASTGAPTAEWRLRGPF